MLISNKIINNLNLNEKCDLIWKKINNKISKNLSTKSIHNFRKNGLSLGVDNTYLRKKNYLTYQKFIKELKKLSINFNEIKFLLPTKKIPGNQDYFKLYGKYFITQNILEYIKIFIYLKKKINLNKVTSIFEIGPGYGELARIFIKKNIKYFIIDASFQNFFFEFSMRKEFPNKKILNISKIDPKLINKKLIYSYDIIIFPIDYKFTKIMKFDLIMNVNSFMEMSKKNIKKYFNIIYTVSKKGSNLFIRNRANHISKQGVNLFCHYPFKNYYKVLHFYEDFSKRHRFWLLLEKSSKNNSVKQVMKLIKERIIDIYGNIMILKLKVFFKNILRFGF